MAEIGSTPGPSTEPSGASSWPASSSALPSPESAISGALTDTQRNGSITGIGIVLGFSLTFAAQWSLGPGEWHYFSVLTLAISFPGIALQLRALFTVLSLPMVSVDEHQRLIKWFVYGVSLVLGGYIVNVILGLAIDKKWFPVP